MKAVSKILKLAGLAAIIVLVILVVCFYFFSGYLLRVGIETAGTKALGVGVYVDDVGLSILGGTIEIDGLIVRNPPGYVHEDLLKLGRGKIQAKVGSLLADTLIIKELRLDGIDLVIEQKALSNNLRDVISSIGSKEKEKKEAEDEEAAEPAGKKLQISELEISNIRVKVKLLPMSGKEDTVTLNLATIKMSNLGTDSELDTGILVSKIFVAIADGVAKQGVGILPKEMVNRMKSALGETLDLGKTTAEEGGKLIEKSKDIGEGIIEGFKGLFKPKKEE